MIYRWLKKALGLLLIAVFVVLFINSALFLKFFYPYPHQELVSKYSTQYGMDPYLVLAVIRSESRFDEKAQSRVGAKGLMQIMPDTGQWIAYQLKLDDYEEAKLNLPQYNIRMGIWYLAYLDKSFAGDTIKLIAAYNAGETKVRKWLEDKVWTGKVENLDQIPYLETRKYVESVLFDYQVYKRIYQENGNNE